MYSPTSAGVPARAAGGEDDAVDPAQLPRREVQAAEDGRRLVAVEPAAHGAEHASRAARRSP